MATTNFCRSLYDEIESIMAPIAELGGPLCIRLVFTRFLHGVYFSDPKHKFYDDDRSG